MQNTPDTQADWPDRRVLVKQDCGSARGGWILKEALL